MPFQLRRQELQRAVLVDRSRVLEVDVTFQATALLARGQAGRGLLAPRLRQRLVLASCGHNRLVCVPSEIVLGGKSMTQFEKKNVAAPESAG